VILPGNSTYLKI